MWPEVDWRAQRRDAVGCLEPGKGEEENGRGGDVLI